MAISLLNVQNNKNLFFGVSSDDQRNLGNAIQQLLFKQWIMLFFFSYMPSITNLLVTLLFIMAKSQQCLPQNCLSCLNPQVCLNCPSGLQCCQDSCLECIDQSQCMSCLQGYIYNSTSQTCYLTNSCDQFACLLCVNSACQMCTSGFSLNLYTYQCVKCPQQCMECKIDGKCLQCYSTYYLQKNGSCIQCDMIANCVECISQYYCTACNVGYTIEYGSLPICISCPGNCKYCTIYTACQVCNTGFYLMHTKFKQCSACSSSCLECYGSASNCVSCNADSFLEGGQCVYCFSAVPDCVACVLGDSGGVVCQNCTVGFYLGENNRCLLCQEKCIVCKNESYCIECRFGYLLDQNNQCQMCQIENCLLCNSTDSCFRCLPTWTTNPDNTSCIPCGPNCYNCNGNQSACLQCSPNFASVGGICVPCEEKNCVVCPGQNIKECTSCLYNYYQSNLYYQCYPCPVFCISCDGLEYCQQCTSPGQISNSDGYCVFGGIYNCFLINQNNNSECSVCEAGYYLASTNICAPCIANCMSCYNGTVCQFCMETFMLAANGTCLPCKQGCLTCYQAGQCSSCPTGTYFANGQDCFDCPVGCSKCSSSNYCLTCSGGFYITAEGLCVTCEADCLFCSASSQCLVCAPGFGLSQTGKCRPCPQGCLVCYLSPNCEVCSQGYALVIENGPTTYLICQACPTNCSLCHSVVNIHTNYSSVRCSQCAFGLLLLQDGSCFRCGQTAETQGCQSCDQQGQCASCVSGFTLNGSGLCANTRRQTLKQENWGLAGACIGLGCLAMLLIIAVLYLKLTKRTNSSSINGF